MRTTLWYKFIQVSLITMLLETLGAKLVAQSPVSSARIFRKSFSPPYRGSALDPAGGLPSQTPWVSPYSHTVSATTVLFAISAQQCTLIWTQCMLTHGGPLVFGVRGTSGLKGDQKSRWLNVLHSMMWVCRKSRRLCVSWWFVWHGAAFFVVQCICWLDVQSR